MRYFYITITIFVLCTFLLVICYYFKTTLLYRKEINKQPDENDLL